MFSKSIEQLIEALKNLPGIGQRTAQRLALHLLEYDPTSAKKLSAAITHALEQVKHCQWCHNLSDDLLCKLCANPKRQQHLLCIVESPSDVMAIEQSGCYSGLYFVLLGHLSPIDGIGPSQIGLDQLQARLAKGEIRELILATNSTVEGEATAHYIMEFVKKFPIIVTRIAHGIPLGGELEYIDAGTIARAIQHRSSMNE